jgi:DNA-binding protein HU-beta
MIKADIVKNVADTLKMKETDALRIVDAILESTKEIIVRDKRLEIRDFGVFQLKERKARIGRNPKNKKEYPIPARKVVTYKMGREMKKV